MNASGRGLGLRLDGVRHSYGVTAKAIEDISLSVPSGSVTAIVGPSGSGKSTLLGIISGAFKPTGGACTIDGTTTAAAAAAGDIGIVFQEPGLLAWSTARQNVSLPLELLGRPADDGRVMAALKLVGLGDFGDFLPHQMSGGMQSRAAIARALVTDPKLVVLDEPFGALDEMTGRKLIEDLSALVSRLGSTTLMVTHSIEHAAFIADRVAVLTPGPGRLAGVVEIDAPRPRGGDFFTSATFLAKVDEIRKVLWGLS